MFKKAALLAGAMAMLAAYAQVAAARPADDWVLVVVGQENNQVRAVIAQTFKTLDDCQSAAQMAAQLSKDRMIHSCLHVDQKFRFTTVQGRWE